MAIGAVVNAVWDLKAKRAGQPLWPLLASLSPEELVDLVDFRYLTDALTRDEALDILRAAEPGRASRTAQLLATGYPAYTTSPGWLGYDDDKLARLSVEAVADGFSQIKLKVGRDLDDDVRRLAIARAAVGPDIAIAIDANQRWDVAEAIEWMQRARPVRPAWIEEPTSPDDVLGHAAIRAGVAPVPVATGEHVANRVMFKQLLAAGAIDVLQIDAARVGGVNENLAILLLAAKFGVPVCPHAGGVGLCELVQHLSMFDFVAVSGAATGGSSSTSTTCTSTSSTPRSSATAATSPRRRPVSAVRCTPPPSRTTSSLRARVDEQGEVVTTGTRAARYVGGHTIDVTPADPRSPGPGEVQIDVAYTGICGTDLHIFHGDMDQRVTGRQFSATRCPDAIAAVGAGRRRAGRSATRSR